MHSPPRLMAAAAAAAKQEAGMDNGSLCCSLGRNNEQTVCSPLRSRPAWVEARSCLALPAWPTQTSPSEVAQVQSHNLAERAPKDS